MSSMKVKYEENQELIDKIGAITNPDERDWRYRILVQNGNLNGMIGLILNGNFGMKDWFHCRNLLLKYNEWQITVKYQHLNPEKVYLGYCRVEEIYYDDLTDDEEEPRWVSSLIRKYKYGQNLGSAFGSLNYINVLEFSIDLIGDFKTEYPEDYEPMPPSCACYECGDDAEVIAEYD